MRTRKALLNFTTALLVQVVTILCGFIVPRLIIGTFGSAVNGLCASITQFLGYIVLLEAGIGGVVKAALYKPLADVDSTRISGIVVAVERFFQKVAVFFVGYVAIVAIGYPFIVNDAFAWTFTFPLVIIIGIRLFAEYYFGLAYKMLLQADQRRYVDGLLQIITIVLSSLVVVVMVKLGFGIHGVKLASAFVFLIKPLFLHIYVRKDYRIDHRVAPDNQGIRQRWDGLGHHIAFYVHKHTDIFVLTLFAKNIAEVSVYSVYHMVVTGIMGVVRTISHGMEAMLGNMIAKNEQETLGKTFEFYELVSFIVTTTFFTTAAIMIIPFVGVYIKGISDVNYIRPVFAYILIASEAVFCLRLPYQHVALAAGHYRKTRNAAIIEAVVNMTLSVVLVFRFGMVGVAIATLCAMSYRAMAYSIYSSRHILNRSILIFVKKIVISMACVVTTCIIAGFLEFSAASYLGWAMDALKVVAIATVVTVSVNAIFYAKTFRELLSILRVQVFAKGIKKSNDVDLKS